MSKQELAVKEEAGLPMVLDFAGDAGDSGFENADASCFQIPFLYILQSGSPQCKKSEGAYIKGTEEGFFFNTVTEDFFDGEKRGAEVVPVAFTRTFTEWVSQDNGGGFKGEHEAAHGEKLLATCTRNDKGHDILPNGHQLVDTRKHFVLYRPAATETEPAGDWKAAIISMSSTQTKKSKKWMTVSGDILIPGTDLKAPMYSQIYKVTTIPESNDKGSWYGWKVAHQAAISDARLYAKAKEFRAMIRSGAAVASTPDTDATDFAY